ncbi:phosphopyruvate hydratase [Candidatus Collierbacteria bacterium RIFCSPLOWO2_01_FULL_50_23]|uniref:Enolase n=2 Tax=Candidatus Collieribacteriota TaxID=1752725 RepID=A0A1F5EWX4_9BACT|nr:MAG: phosphopyruvate hydratase [Candidatus Collierbacteria bacterium RIFCSPHIGHO2_02_FULL_49_10]OGD72211.1 MAG: phosphopyruvate hydratase [Candidatus Collierbacteria bacterium RIFCSPHIGHO2_01_FULL_50_25]OGD75156.1 MAG: phosphopyruvate hydratase [Candidatus Collierbacteria bacterium RIFCSPLOWO2_01_FULL_50_23]
MAKIKAIHAREILDSRGTPTIETTVWSDDDHGAVSSVPSGASTGRFEALELRDGDPTRFDGQGVLKAVDNINNIISKYVVGQDPTKQNGIDQILLNIDGTASKSKLGGNAILSVSQAVCELGALVSNLQTYEYLAEKYALARPTSKHLPTPIFNLINGGKHGAGNLDFQEFHLIPSSQVDFKKALQIGDEVYQSLKKVLINKKAVHSVGDEGGFAPNLFNNVDALELLIEAVNNTPYKLNADCFLGLDIAANSFYKNGKYQIKDRQEPYSAEEFIKYLVDLKKQYNLLSIEDPFDQDAWQHWVNLYLEMGQETMIVGDDLLVTDKTRLQKAIELHACNAVLVKPNQIGTISETVQVVKLAKKNNFSVVVSHRSGDTDEDFIADFAVGIGADYAKFGAPNRMERVAKYNRLSFIEEYLAAAGK